MAAPVGNKNAAKSRMFEQALIRTIKQRDLKQGEGETLRKICEALLDKAMDGELRSATEIRDTLDGRPAQAIVGADGGPVEIVNKIERVIVDNAKT